PECYAQLESAYNLTFPSPPTNRQLATADLFDNVLSLEDDQFYTRCYLTGQNNDIGAFTYDKTGGAVTSMWTKTAHGLTDLQEVWFSAVGTGAEPFVVDTHYWVIWQHANYVQLASSLANAIADTYIAGTGTDSSGTWTMRVCGTQQVATRPADAQWWGRRILTETGLLLWTDAEVDTRATDEMNRRHALLGTLRPTSMTVKWHVGKTVVLAESLLLFPLEAVEVTFDPGTGAARVYEVYTMGGTISGSPGAPVTIVTYTEDQAQFTA
ncbi:MAG: hypothetical protein V2A79_01910, partial [Planctomycetota bacterium]